MDLDERRERLRGGVRLGGGGRPPLASVLTDERAVFIHARCKPTMHTADSTTNNNLKQLTCTRKKKSETQYALVYTRQKLYIFRVIIKKKKMTATLTADF